MMNRVLKRTGRPTTVLARSGISLSTGMALTSWILNSARAWPRREELAVKRAKVRARVWLAESLKLLRMIGDGIRDGRWEMGDWLVLDREVVGMWVIATAAAAAAETSSSSDGSQQ